MTETMVNGDQQRSHFLALQHLSSYPVVSDGITTYKTNPYGEKSLSIAQDAYSRFAVPFFPYLRGPYSYVAPYVNKADELGDRGLSHIDERFPIVKSDTKTIKGNIRSIVYFPYDKANEGKVYVIKTYEDESGKTEGKGLPHLVKSVVSTELKIASDVLHALAEWLGPKKERAEKTVDEKVHALRQEVKQ